jgi:hypothetical protein
MYLLNLQKMEKNMNKTTKLLATMLTFGSTFLVSTANGVITNLNTNANTLVKSFSETLVPTIGQNLLDYSTTIVSNSGDLFEDDAGETNVGEFFEQQIDTFDLDGQDSDGQGFVTTGSINGLLNDQTKAYSLLDLMKNQGLQGFKFVFYDENQLNSYLATVVNGNSDIVITQSSIGPIANLTKYTNYFESDAFIYDTKDAFQVDGYDKTGRAIALAALGNNTTAIGGTFIQALNNLTADQPHVYNDDFTDIDKLTPAFAIGGTAFLDFSKSWLKVLVSDGSGGSVEKGFFLDKTEKDLAPDFTEEQENAINALTDDFKNDNDGGLLGVTSNEIQKAKGEAQKTHDDLVNFDLSVLQDAINKLNGVDNEDGLIEQLRIKVQEAKTALKATNYPTASYPQPYLNAVVLVGDSTAVDQNGEPAPTFGTVGADTNVSDGSINYKGAEQILAEQKQILIDQENDQKITDALDIANGNDTVDGSVAKAVASALAAFNKSNEVDVKRADLKPFVDQAELDYVAATQALETVLAALKVRHGDNVDVTDTSVVQNAQTYANLKTALENLKAATAQGVADNNLTLANAKLDTLAPASLAEQVAASPKSIISVDSAGNITAKAMSKEDFAKLSAGAQNRATNPQPVVFGKADLAASKKGRTKSKKRYF